MVCGARVLALCVRQGGGAAALNRLPLLAANSPASVQACLFTNKVLREPGYKRPAPFPYKEKKYNFLRAHYDDTTQRFDDNTKIVVIDGPPTGNKDKFARAVAEELDMHYIPGANLDELYVNPYGFDRRTLNDKMPYISRSFDIADFLRKPTHGRATKMQFEMMLVRYRQYQRALNHLLNTGQGVVMHRSIYSDIVFMETMCKLGYVTDTALSFYYECREQGMPEFLRPHLIIYLDIPVDQIIKNVAARGRPEETNSPLYTKEALATLETIYKEKYLKPMSDHCELLVYDWSEEGAADLIVEDMCRLNLEDYTTYDRKLRDWQFRNEWEWKGKRIRFSVASEEMELWLNVPRMPCPELVISGDDRNTMNKILSETPGEKFDYGFNTELGDKVLFKW